MEKSSYNKQKDYKGLPYKSISDVAKETFTYIKQRKNREIKSLKTPWKKFNKASMGGIEWNTIITIAGMSGSGKTAMINQLETSLIDLNPDQKFGILSFNFEMLARNLVGRKVSNKVKKTTQEIYSASDKELTDEDLLLIRQELKRISQYDIHYIDIPGTVEQIRKSILSFALSRGNNSVDSEYGVVVTLDHSLLVLGEGERQTLIDLMSMFNNLKKSIKVTFIILSQLNRNIESSERIKDPLMHYPKKQDIFASDALYQFSDIVLVSHNPRMLGIRYYGPQKIDTTGKIFHHYLKMREGEPFIAVMKDNLKYNEVLDA